MYEGVRVGYISMSSEGNHHMLIRFGPLPEGLDIKGIVDIVRLSYLQVSGISGEPVVQVNIHGKKSVGVRFQLPPNANGEFSKALHEIVESTLRKNPEQDWKADGMS